MKTQYEKGKRWGHAIFNANLAQGKTGIQKSDAAAQTARKYARDKSIQKTKTGKQLDPAMRMLYAGVHDGFFEAFQKYERSLERKKR